MGAAAGYVLACRILGPDMVVRTAWTSSTPTLSGNAGESESARFFITCRCCWVQSYSSSVLAILATIQANSSPWRPVCGSAVPPILGFDIPLNMHKVSLSKLNEMGLEENHLFDGKSLSLKRIDPIHSKATKILIFAQI